MPYSGPTRAKTIAKLFIGVAGVTCKNYRLAREKTVFANNFYNRDFPDINSLDTDSDRLQAQRPCSPREQPDAIYKNRIAKEQPTPPHSTYSLVYHIGAVLSRG